VLAMWARRLRRADLSLFEGSRGSAAGQAAGVAHMAAHARGAAAYAAKAAGLAAPDDPTAVADEVRWQQSHGSSTVRDVLRRLPAPTRPARMLGALISDMHTRLTAGG
jgi:hypothetical protein